MKNILFLSYFGSALYDFVFRAFLRLLLRIDIVANYQMPQLMLAHLIFTSFWFVRI